MRRAVLLVVVLMAPLAWASNAYDDPDGGDATGWNTQRKVARAADGSVFVTYLVETPDALHTEVVVARVAPDGSVSELPRPMAAQGDVSRSSMVFDAWGDLHVAWTERAVGDREVFHAVFRDGAWADAMQLSGGLGYAGFPSLAADAEGRVHVAWYGFDGRFYQAFYRRYVEGAWEPAVQLSSGNLDANNPSVLVDAQGRAHVVWYKDDGHRYRIWHAVREADANFTLPQGLPSASQEEVDAYNAALAMDARGVVHAVWDEKHADGYWVVHSTWSATSGWATPDVLARGDAGGEYPAFAAWRDGVLVAWSDRNGTLVGTDLTRAPAPLLGGVSARNPSLRGPAPVPESERTPVLDLLVARAPASGVRDDAWSVEHLALPSSCSPFEAPEGCAEGATWRRVTVERQEEKERTPTPVGAWVAVVGTCAAVALARAARRFG